MTTVPAPAGFDATRYVDAETLERISALRADLLPCAALARRAVAEYVALLRRILAAREQVIEEMDIEGGFALVDRVGSLGLELSVEEWLLQGSGLMKVRALLSAFDDAMEAHLWVGPANSV